MCFVMMLFDNDLVLSLASLVVLPRSCVCEARARGEDVAPILRLEIRKLQRARLDEGPGESYHRTTRQTVSFLIQLIVTVQFVVVNFVGWIMSGCDFANFDLYPTRHPFLILVLASRSVRSSRLYMAV